LEGEYVKSLTSSQEFIKKVRKGLWSEGKKFIQTPENQRKYLIYKENVLKYLQRENLDFEIISIRPTGRIKTKDGFKYNDNLISYKEFTSSQKAFLTKFLTRLNWIYKVFCT